MSGATGGLFKACKGCFNRKEVGFLAVQDLILIYLEVFYITCEDRCDSNDIAIYMCTSDEELTLKAYIVS